MKSAYVLLATAAIFASAACNAEKRRPAAARLRRSRRSRRPTAIGPSWSADTPEGGFLMGNPNAEVKLVEFGSMTCPHCAEFEEKGGEKLIDNYVKTGRVSYEFRNFVRDPFDMTASLIARCGGPERFFRLDPRRLFADQRKWIGKAPGRAADQQQALQAMPPARGISRHIAKARRLAAVGGAARRSVGQEQRLPGQSARGQSAGADERRRDDAVSGISGHAVLPDQRHSCSKETATWDKLEPQDSRRARQLGRVRRGRAF